MENPMQRERKYVDFMFCYTSIIYNISICIYTHTYNIIYYILKDLYM